MKLFECLTHLLDVLFPPDVGARKERIGQVTGNGPGAIVDLVRRRLDCGPRYGGGSGIRGPHSALRIPGIHTSQRWP